MVAITLRHSATCFWKGKLRTWYELITLAEKYGWKPDGTLKPPHYEGEKEWDGDYMMPLGQIVSASDAGALAQVLRHALVGTSTLINGDARRTVAEFAKFCQKGEFELVPIGRRVRARSLD